MRISRLTLLLLFATLVPVVQAGAQAPPQPPRPAERQGEPGSTRLPVRRVVLYKSGVGYFEHIGRVTGSETVSIDLTSRQLDDVLKSLTTVDLGGGEVTGITYNSEAPLDQRLRMLRIPLGGETTRTALFKALRGARVGIPGGMIGRILSVTSRTRSRGDATESVDELTVVTDGGDVRTIELGTGGGVRLVEADLRRDLAQYLDLLSSTRAQDLRRLSVATRGSGTRDLFVSYVSEVPVWKTTYRLVIPTDASRTPFLQGWAIVDNTLGEDWTNVELSLVAGAPQSFIQRLSQPLFTRRPVVPLPDHVQFRPQTHGGAVETFAEAPARDAARFSAPAPGKVGGMVGGMPDAPPPPPPGMMAEAVVVGARADAEALGELFEYRLKGPVTIARNGSALVPIVQADVTVDRVSLWNPALGLRPLRAIWLTNDTGLTLDGGSLTLIEGGAFAGEGLIEPVTAGERRLISYATDLAMRVTSSEEGGPQRVARVRLASGVLTQFLEERAATVYTARNESDEPRNLVIEHPRRDGWQLADGVTPAETTESVYRFRVTVQPRATATLHVDEVRPIETTVSASNIKHEHIRLLLQARTLNPTLAPQVEQLGAQAQEVARLQAEVAARREEVKRIGEDQARVRENLKALKGSDAERALVERYTRQLGAQEDRLELLRTEIERLQAEATAAQQAFTKSLTGLTLDVRM